jgi:hypothetical protein
MNTALTKLLLQKRILCVLLKSEKDIRCRGVAHEEVGCS